MLTTTDYYIKHTYVHSLLDTNYTSEEIDIYVHAANHLSTRLLIHTGMQDAHCSTDRVRYACTGTVYALIV